MDQRTAISSFRQVLKEFGEIQYSHGNPITDLAYETLLKEFDHYFGEKYDWTRAPMRGVNLSKAVKKYCHPDPTCCPICGQKMDKKTNRKTGNTFLGCPDWPNCQGTRSKDGTINMNRHLREYLISMMESKAQPLNEPSRFDLIETDDDE